MGNINSQGPTDQETQTMNNVQQIVSSILKITAGLPMAVATTASAQTFTLLHSFTGREGANPMGSLILSNGTLYGMTSQGGVAGSGVVFKMNTNGSGCTNLHSFSAYAGNGESPNAGLVLSGSTLYGLTPAGSSIGLGLVFRENINASGYTNLHSFAGAPKNGAIPYGSLTLANGKLYGLTMHGGTNDLGLLFRMNADGIGYTNLHVFVGYPSDGGYPMGDLILSGTTFYGMASEGGPGNFGTVFRLNIDGTGYTNLHSFAGYPSEGSGPAGSLTLDGSTLYGMTQQGGANMKGTVFKMNTDGSGYTNLHSFAGGAGDGASPQGSLTLVNGWLYGMTPFGGASDYGVVFRVSTDGSSYTNFHSFAGGAGDGATPYGSLMLSGSTIYGMTYYGGTNNEGVVFTLSNLPPAPPTSLTIIYTNNQAIVSWPSSVSGCTLQTNNDLTKGTWSNYTGPIISNAVTNSPTKGNLFFRLRYP
jgi:uncharacterized repeat protein (TIGR03803 family)